MRLGANLHARKGTIVDAPYVTSESEAKLEGNAKGSPMEHSGEMWLVGVACIKLPASEGDFTSGLCQ